MNRFASKLSVAVAAGLSVCSVRAEVISTFDTDLDGWSAVGFQVETDPLAILLGADVLTKTDNSADIVHDAGGDLDPLFSGNPGGFARFQDIITDPGSFAEAPAKFTGDLSSYIGGTFSYDHRLFAEGVNPTSVGPYVFVFISGDPNDLNAYGVVVPGPGLGAADTGWVTISANLTDGGPGGLLPFSDLDLGVFDPGLAGSTAGDFGFSGDKTFEQVMADVTSVIVSFELVDNNSSQASEAGGIDNIILAEVPEPGSIALLAVGGMALLRRRQAR